MCSLSGLAEYGMIRNTQFMGAFLPGRCMMLVYDREGWDQRGTTNSKRGATAKGRAEQTGNHVLLYKCPCCCRRERKKTKAAELEAAVAALSSKAAEFKTVETKHSALQVWYLLWYVQLSVGVSKTCGLILSGGEVQHSQYQAQWLQVSQQLCFHVYTHEQVEIKHRTLQVLYDLLLHVQY